MSEQELAATDEHAKHFSEQGFWAKLAGYALAAGRVLVQKALTLYYAARSADTPTWAKAAIFGALGYFILPADLIPDILPGVGFTDDYGVLVAALTTVARHIKPEHEENARAALRQWFSTEG